MIFSGVKVDRVLMNLWNKKLELYVVIDFIGGMGIGKIRKFLFYFDFVFDFKVYMRVLMVWWFLRLIVENFGYFMVNS